MALTYTEIEEEKSFKIFVFFLVAILFYFLTAFIVSTVVKLFLSSYLAESGTKILPYLTLKQILYIAVFAFVAGIIHSIFSIYNAASFIQKNLNAQYIDPTDSYHKRFNTIVDEVNVACGSKYDIKPVVLPTTALNAFAISTPGKKAMLGVTEGLLAKLNRQQLQAVVAHEMAHIASGDSYQTTVGCALFGIYAAILAGLGAALRSGRFVRVRGGKRGGGGGSIIILILIIYMVLSIMQFFYLLIRLMVSRNRELRADAIAIRLTRDPISLSEALILISKGWRGFGNVDKNLETLFIVNPLRQAYDEKEGFWSNLRSTHPPTEKRIKILTDMAHVNPDDIAEAVEARQKVKASLKEIDDEKKENRWYLRNDQGKWEGPFNVGQMLQLKWLVPTTWIKPVQSNKVIRARDDVLLEPVFSSRLEGHNKTDYKCPGCHKSLVKEHYEGVEIYRCLFCKGILVGTDKIMRILAREDKGFSDKTKRIAEKLIKERLAMIGRKRKRYSQESLIKCPKCNYTMARTFYSGAYPVEIDRCLNCNLLWFDKDELEVLQYLVENKKAV